MSYAIVYSSRTGNTALLAQALREALPQEGCSYFGEPHAEALSADTIYVLLDRQGDLRRVHCPLFAEPDRAEGVPLRHRRIWRRARLL